MAPRLWIVDVISVLESYQDQLHSNQRQHIDSLEINAPLLKFMCGHRRESKEGFNQVEYSMNLANWPRWLGDSVSAEWYPDIEFDEKVELWALQIIHDFGANDLGHESNSERHLGSRRKYWKYEGLVVSSEDCATWSRLGCFKISVATDWYSAYNYEWFQEEPFLPTMFSIPRKIKLV
jgi:hypothetical protein